MFYIFVVNGRNDMRERIDTDLRKQLEGRAIRYSIYHTEGPGDGLRYVRIHCDLYPAEEECFIACGGSGTANEVASGIVGYPSKSMAILAYGSSNDLIKYYPDRNFHSLDCILRGENVKIDIIKANENYSLNVINCGFDAMVAHEANRFLEQGKGQKGYVKAVWKCLLWHRFNHIKVTADGERLNRRTMVLCTLSNAGWCGGKYYCAPNARTDDGLIDVCLFKSCTLLSFLLMMGKYTRGKHLSDPYCKKHLVYRQVRHAELESKDLIFLGLDGEISAATHFDIDILPGAINLVLPASD